MEHEYDVRVYELSASLLFAFRQIIHAHANHDFAAFYPNPHYADCYNFAICDHHFPLLLAAHSFLVAGTFPSSPPLLLLHHLLHPHGHQF